MTDVVVDRLRIRGSGARRLATVAARALPGALDRALADLADVDLGELTVRLDPADHDDATIAALWADGIRQAALAAGARVRASAGTRLDDPAAEPTVRAAAGPGIGPGPAPGVTDDELVAAASDWLAAGAPDLVPATFATLSDARTAATVLRRLGAERAEAFALALTAAAEVTHTPARPTGPTVPADGAAAAAQVRAVPHQPASAAAAAADARPVPSDEAALRALAARVTDAARTLRPLLELGESTPVDLAGATMVAGVVLAYPWLADLCRTAVDLHPDAEPSHPRRVALAALADPEDAGLVDDPLVRFLAGAPEDATPAAGLAPLDAVDEVHAAAEDVLRRFVALLPGFERSSAGFVRDAWVLRTGLLDVAHDPATLLARTAPLDVVLPLLPYPMGALRLPWTPVLSVRFR
jgi:hypothetical protein